MDYYLASTIFDFLELTQCCKISSSVLPNMLPYVQKRAGLKIHNFLQFATKITKDVCSSRYEHIIFNNTQNSSIVKKSTILFYLENYTFDEHMMPWYYGLHVPYKKKIVTSYKESHQLKSKLQSKYDFIHLLQKMTMDDIMIIGY